MLFRRALSESGFKEVRFFGYAKWKAPGFLLLNIQPKWPHPQI